MQELPKIEIYSSIHKGLDLFLERIFKLNALNYRTMILQKPLVYRTESTAKPLRKVHSLKLCIRASLSGICSILMRFLNLWNQVSF
jgi:hypothetical protein